MPVYDYECADCGAFTEMRPMSENATPCACPECGADSPRVILAMPALFGVSAGRRRAMAANEASRHSPMTSSEYAASRRHPAGCRCCSGTPKSSATMPNGAKTFPSARPWMISH